ncbi:MAG: DNA internalization-related competence protein ComEC/Rec2 [Trueperaceae bacterium]
MSGPFARSVVLVPAHPWPLPAALGLACGIVARAGEVPGWGLLFLLPAVWPLRFLLLRPAIHGEVGALPARALLVVLLPLLFVTTGYLRFHQWDSLPDPLAGLREHESVLSGSSDGRLLTLDDPPGTRVAIAPSGSLLAGRVELRGTLVQAAGRRNPGGFDYHGYLRRRGVHGQVLVEEVLSVLPRAGPLDRLSAGVTRGLPPDAAALMEAMTLGVRDDLGELRDDFAAAGLAHVLALSGLHVGLLMAAAGWLLAPLGVLRYPLLLALDFGYMVLVGASPSVVRAAIMVGVVLLSLWAGAGRIEPWPALGVAALVTLVARPSWLFDISLQLSYGAVAGILLFALPLAKRLRGDPPLPWWHPRVSILGAGLTSVAAQGLTLPLVASSFGSLPLLSPLVNIAALPLASLLVPLGFIAGLLGLLALPLAGLLNSIIAPLAGLLLDMARVGAGMPALTWGEVEPVGFIYFLLALAALALAVNGALKLWRALLVVATAMLLSSATPAAHSTPEIIALDVGQGDSILLRFPGRIEVLVDAGGTPFSDYDTGSGTVLPALRALGIDELELVIATHADLDHIEGLVSVIRGIPVQLLAVGVSELERPIFAELMEAAEARNVPVRSLLRGERLGLGRAVLEVLNPPPRSYGASNDDSVALALYLSGVPRALLLGDISEVVERDLTPPEVDILIAPHHGSGSSTSTELLRAARPKEVIISVGRNGYGHPSASVLDRIESIGARVHVTREEGAVRLPLGP